MSQVIDLSSYTNLQQALFVYINVPDYGPLRMSTYDAPISIMEDDSNYYTYTPNGILLSVSEFNNELQPSRSDVTISLAAIDQAFVAGMMNYALKGSEVVIRRAFFNVQTGVMLNIAGNPSRRFSGIIANYSFNDEFNELSQTTTTTISVSCTSIVSVFEQKITGQQTNSSERKYLYPGDTLTVSGLTGTGFSIDVLTTGANGAIATTGRLVGGSGYTNGTFTAQALVGGTGTSAQATLTVSGGAVTAVTITTPGTGYIGDDASFTRVATIAISNFDFGKPV